MYGIENDIGDENEDGIETNRGIRRLMLKWKRGMYGNKDENGKEQGRGYE